ncbi:GntR family transcriptional regulator [Streptomyces sp. ICBB 8177]|nr:GntR family transcriptional regulator [Streptomyces sp. ICBB 8177]
MTGRAIRRTSVSEQTFVILRDRIVAGDLAPGQPLPAERELAQEFGVNRHAVREALRRLQQARLVEVSHGGRTIVLDWRRTAGLDLAVGGAGGSGPVDLPGLEQGAWEMRACVGADAARLCALRADRSTTDAITAATDRYARSQPDLEALGAADVAWWRLIVEGSGNLAYLLAFNTLVQGALAEAGPPTATRTAELLDVAAHRQLATLIASHEPEASWRLARDLLSRSLIPSRTGERVR